MELQGTHVSGGDQFARLHAQVGTDQLHRHSALDAPYPACGTEGEVVRPERRAGQPQPQAAAARQIKECLPPGQTVGLVGIHPEVMGFVRDRQTGGAHPGFQGLAEMAQLPACPLVGQHQTVGGLAIGAFAVGWPWPLLQVQPEPLPSAQPLMKDRGAVAEHQAALQLSVLLERPECQQGTEGLAGSRTGEHQHILFALGRRQQTSPQQLDQLLLPASRPQGGGGRSTR